MLLCYLCLGVNNNTHRKIIKMYTLENRIEKYRTKYENKPKEKIQLQDIEEIKQKVIDKSCQQPQKNQDDYLKEFTIRDYLSDLEFTPGNLSWIERLLKWKPKAKQYELLKKYKELYLEAYNNTVLGHQKANAGTLKANTWLRVLITGE